MGNHVLCLCLSVITDVPDAHVRLGSSLDPDSIREGTDVYFDCIVTAHPAVYKVEWKHNVSFNPQFDRLVGSTVLAVFTQSYCNFRYFIKIKNESFSSKTKVYTANTVQNNKWLLPVPYPSIYFHASCQPKTR